MRKKRVIFMILVMAIPFWTGCSKEDPPKPPDKVSVQLKWLHQPQFAGLYAADQEGFFAEENMEVTLAPGGVKVDEVEQVVSGKMNFGVIAAQAVLAEIANGKDIKALAVIFRRNPSVYFALKDSGIINPRQFVGRKVLVFPTDYIFPALLTKMGIGMDQIETVPPTFNLAPFFDRKVDVWTGYLTNQVVTARQKGHKLNIFFPDDYGIHTYSDTIIATNKLIRENPDLVERFLRATMKGWKWAIENPEKAAVMSLKYNPELIPERQIAEMEASIPLVHTGEDQIGWMKSKVWQGMHDMLIDQGVLSKPVELNRVYTLTFLEKIYGKLP